MPAMALQGDERVPLLSEQPSINSGGSVRKASNSLEPSSQEGLWDLQLFDGYRVSTFGPFVLLGKVRVG